MSKNTEILKNTADANLLSGIIIAHCEKGILKDNIANSNKEHGIYIHETPNSILTANQLNNNGKY